MGDFLREKLNAGAFDAAFSDLYGRDADGQRARYLAALNAFCHAFGAREDAAFFSAPGRSEIGGNHTDHQRGRVLAATVTLDMIAVAAPRTDGRICIRSAGYSPIKVSLERLAPLARERGSSAAFVRGVAAKLHQTGYLIGGFDAFVASNVPKGSGLSSSAAYGILMATLFSELYNGGGIPPVTQALAAKHAENVHFGKPSGLLDQLACAEGGFVAMDFRDPDAPLVERVECDLFSLGYEICIVNAGGSHSGLTQEYASVPQEMHKVAAVFGKTCLREVDESAFYEALPMLREKTSDRAILRSIHFFAEDARVVKLVAALKEKDMPRFAALMNESGTSSFEYLQNVCANDPKERSVALALALSERLLRGDGAWRVHGGGFAGTIQALVPNEKVEGYILEMERVFGKGCCYRLSVRPVGGVRLNG